MALPALGRPSSPWLAHVASGGALWPVRRPTTKRPDVADVGRLGGTRGGRYSFAAKCPRSVLTNRASFPFTAISRRMAL